MLEHNGKKYRSKKHPVLEHIFQKYYDSDKKQDAIPFYLSDIHEGYSACGIDEPASISNTILDLTRQDRGIHSRVPESISELGYDLRKRTGADSTGRKLAGEFVYVGAGYQLTSWLVWPDEMEQVVIDSSRVPALVRDLVTPVEAGLFSIIDYTELLSKVLHQGKVDVFRIQNPMKWQPNEIDGFYAAECEGKLDLYPIEAKSLRTGDEVNMDQVQGAFRTVKKKMSELKIHANIQLVAMRMIANGVRIAVFPKNHQPEKPEKYYEVIFNPPIKGWT